MKRMLGPGLAELEAAGRLPERLQIVAASREARDTAEFRNDVSEALAEHAPRVAQSARDALAKRLSFEQADATSREDVRRLLDGAHGPTLVYLALPPATAGASVKAVAAACAAAGSRLALEKPFGTDLASAAELNRTIRARFSEDDVYRIDHFLGLRTVRNMVALRFGSRAIGALLSTEHVARVEITWDETLALEGRAGYFDGTGVLRDLIQNHLLQVLALAAMEAPDSLAPCDLRARKLDLLRAVETVSPAEAARHSVRARYTWGRISGKNVKAYADEEGVDPSNDTETFARLDLSIGTERWRGVPFVLRAGKALAQNRRRVVFVLRPSAHRSLFERAGESSIEVSLEPDGLALELPVAGESLTRLLGARLSSELPVEALGPYARVVDALLRGDPTTSVGGDETEECWRIVSPFLEAWERGLSPLREYPAGSSGPGAASPGASTGAERRT